MKKTWIVTGACALAAILTYTLFPNVQVSGLPYLDTSVTRQGQQLYAENCASCHGANLEGQANWKSRDKDGYLPAPPHDETGHTWHHPMSVLIATTALGTEELIGNGYKSHMPGFQSTLSEAEIVAVLAYIKSSWPQKVIDIHNQINAEAES